MQSEVPRKPPVSVTPEGWTVADPTTFRFLVDHAPPRHRWLTQALRLEVRDWRVLVWWILGAGTVAVGLFLGIWPQTLLGLGFLGVWLWLFRLSARAFRNGPLLLGVVEELGQHPLGRGYSAARVKLLQGRIVAVVLPSALASEVGMQEGQVEVLFLDCVGAQYSMVLGVRAALAEGAGSSGEKT